MMNEPHLALYRKYRPLRFEEVEGQELVVNALREAATSRRISHAYLFSGTRGTGKTSIARIFAREIGCKDTDLYEIDAASNRGIDDIRELREAVKTLPFESKYKVYIIDEAHMLTKDASNALLKTLEEPPAHAVFILATTAPKKLLYTVVSRCQHMYFKKPSIKTLARILSAVAKKEGFMLEEDSAELLAFLGDGSFRDAFGTLEKVLSEAKQKIITRKETERIVGVPEAVLVDNFLRGIVRRDASVALYALSQVAVAGAGMDSFLKLVLGRLREALLLKFSTNKKNESDTDDTVFLREIASDNAILFYTLKELLSVEQAVSRSFIPELPIELAVIKLCGYKETT